MDLGTVTSYRRVGHRRDLALAPGEALLAGGTWLFSEPQPSLQGLVDLTTLGWPDTEPLPDGGLRLAATCPIALVRDLGPDLFQQCADSLVMSFKVQQVATVGGNLCLALPAGAMTSLAAGLDGVAVVWTAGGGERRVRVADLVIGVGRTTLSRGDVLRAVDLPGWAVGAPTAFRRASLAASGRSGVLVVGVRRPDGRTRVTVTAATTRPVVLDDTDDPVAIDCWHDDPHGAPDWRAAVTARLVAEVREELR